MVDRALAEKAVQGPAIGLIVAGALGIVLEILNILMHVLGLGAELMDDPQFRQYAGSMMASGALGIVLSVVGIAVGGFIIWTAMKMKALENKTMSMVGAIIAMVPCLSPCCCIGLPIGIWALVVLNKPEVKEAFTS